MGIAWCPLVLEKKCELTTPHNFGSRNPSVLTEIKISPSAIVKKHKNGSSLVSVGPREKMRINNPTQFWVKESICYLNLNFSKFSEYSEVRLPAILYVSHMLIDYRVRELYVTHVYVNPVHGNLFPYEPPE